MWEAEGTVQSPHLFYLRSARTGAEGHRHLLVWLCFLQRLRLLPTRIGSEETRPGGLLSVTMCLLPEATVP